jgi:transposase, IS5 family
MKLYNTLVLKFEHPDWSRNPEFGLIDTILESYPNLIKILEDDITKGLKNNIFGRQDTPSVEQIVRAAIFKEMKGLDYRELEYAQLDSRICANFIKLDERKPFSFQMFQSYISKIRAESLTKLLVEINKIAIEQGYEDLVSLRQDSTVVETNIHYPTNNSLVWDCIKTSTSLLSSLKEEISEIEYRDYTRTAKKTYYNINVTKTKDERVDLFNKQLITFTKAINQTSNIIKKKSECSLKAEAIYLKLIQLQPLMEQVYDMTYSREILGEKVDNDQKLFSIYELHTNIIVKGSREVKFGHKVNLSTGKSNLILDCETVLGNPKDSTLYESAIERILENYKIIPRDSVTDGGYASNSNSQYAKGKGIVNIVFNKVVGSLQNIVSSKNMETRLKKWRSGIEAVISNLKRGFNLRRCEWKGWEHFQAKVLWSTIAYNFRVLTRITLEMMPV